jgi:putative DNA primase/helicase
MSITDFIAFLSKNECAPARPSDIEAGTERRLIASEQDKQGRKSLYYSLNDGATFGSFYNCRNGDCDYWQVKRDPSERVDRVADKDARDKLRRGYEQERDKAAKQAAVEASERWALSDSASHAHTYLIKKRISPHGIGQDGDDLLIPMRHAINGPVIGLQAITPSGAKYFGKDVAKKGAFFLIGEPARRIYICEGYATGATVHEATDDPVVIAFDAGNLKPVSATIRAAFPDAQIIIAGDNDHKTPNNPGETYARQAALECNGCVHLPPVGEGTDWNDYYLEHGIDAIIDRFALVDSFPHELRKAGRGATVPVDDSQSVPPASSVIEALSESVGEVSPVPPAIKPWTERLIPKGFDKAGGMIIDPRSLHNAVLLIGNLPELKGVFRYNDFKKEIFVCKCPPWEPMDSFRVRRMESIDITRCEAYLEVSDGMRIGTNKILCAIDDVADRDRFHPVREYFESLKWDGVPRLATWLKDYAGCVTQPDEYLAAVGTIWMVAGVRRIRQPGCKFDIMPVFEGGEGVKKSSMLRTLATFGRDVEEEYFADGIRFEAIHERGSVMKMQGKMIIEFAEMAGFSNKDIKAVQAWVTLQEDEIEVKHKQQTAIHLRQFITAGTYNPVQGNGWIANIPGMRRFLPISVTKRIDLDGIREVREQLWSEAAHLEAQGYKIYIDNDDDVFKIAAQERQSRQVVDVWEDSIADFINDRKAWKTNEIMEKLNLPIFKRNGLEHRRVCSSMESLGWEYTKVRNLNWQRGWVRKGDDQTPPPPAAVVGEEVEGW